MDCLGCRISNGMEPNVNIIFENELIACVLDIAPFNEGHTLILPKQHFWDVEDMDTGTAQSRDSKHVGFVMQQLGFC
ncbi:HIT family protein [Paenibacillus frigoriresistens]|uniref:HIT family protein n=1 Tax=Paenibacillus alginolyticus TaxID=59839 RepID=UPI001565F30C|nr:HIT family protein [Paenibacillus frigoriresistens]NRF93905.1 HIT family protein [Paenibacillus frigoriresistens]